MSWLWWSVATILIWGLWGVLSKIALLGLAWHQVMFFGSALGLGVSLLAVLLSRSPLLPQADILWPGLIAGALGTAGSITLYLALGSGGRASVVVPLTAAYPVVTAVLSMVLLREQLEPTKLLAVGLFLVATVLVTR